MTVQTTPSGLQYEVLTPGTGTQTPKPTDTVLVHYEGRLLDGTVFDSSYQRREPISFRLNQVIAGWTEGVGLMTIGAKHRLTIPGNLAYGARGVPGLIPANATLVFDVELLDINP
jgi:peptidylprolyl isomerase